MADHLIWLSQANGTQLFGYRPKYGLDYSMIVNSPGRFRVTLDGSIETSLWQIVNTPDYIPTGAPPMALAVDMKVDIWRAHAPPGFVHERTYLIREITRYTDDDGNNLVQISGPCVLDLLDRRIVAYSAGTANADKTDMADDLIKDMVRENLGPGAVAGRNLSSTYWQVEADKGQGASVTIAGSTRNVLDVCQEAADASRTLGTPIAFDIVPLTAQMLEFRTFKGQRGQDRSLAQPGQVWLSQEAGSLANPSRTEDWDDEANVIWTTGIGAAIESVVEKLSDVPRKTASIWGRSEYWENTRSAATTEGTYSRATTALAENRPRRRFQADIVDNEQVKYGREWRWGDKVIAAYLNQTYVVDIREITVQVSASGAEQVKCHFEVTS